MYRTANAGHVGCSLSCAEMLVFIKFSWMQSDDRLILSKGHAAAALYSVLAEDRMISEEEVSTFYRDGTHLSAHPPVNKIKGIPFATGSLGHGLSLSAGMALATRLKKQNHRIFCVTSDGELDEGSSWEAALFIAHHRLCNVVWLIDRNGLQGIGKTEEISALEPLDEKLRAFGYYVAKADGHDFVSLAAAKSECERIINNQHIPCVVLCTTVKGNGLGALQGTVDCHYLPMKEEQYQQTLRDLDSQHQDLMKRGAR